MKSLLSALAAASLVLAFPAHSAEELSEGTVRKIDAPAQRVMVQHGPIKNLGMGPMTMMFKAKDAAMLKTIKEGDKVRFRVEDIGGEYTITRIEAAK
ncbi:MAG: copper-binding protein [Rhodocyclaceae bacterium]|jgi:Cu/Ag efflux protein CusF|nr:copper-binding protein [Rhodocyclaceae bacterium]